MPFLMDICFDNDRRLRRRHYLFEYKGAQFKLMQSNSQKWADHLLTLLPNHDETMRERAFAVASEFLSALSWENNAKIAVWVGGGRGGQRELRLSKAIPVAKTFRRIAFQRKIVGYELSTIPNVETEQQRIALSLYREATASTNDYLSFLFYWQILETGGTNAEDFVNKCYRKKPEGLQLGPQSISRVHLNGKSLGQYLRDECRDAIAHIRRKLGKTKIDLDRWQDRLRISISTQIVKVFAEYYIREVLKLQKQLHLMRENKSGIPVFVDGKYIAERS